MAQPSSANTHIDVSGAAAALAVILGDELDRALDGDARVTGIGTQAFLGAITHFHQFRDSFFDALASNLEVMLLVSHHTGVRHERFLRAPVLRKNLRRSASARVSVHMAAAFVD